MKPFLIPFDATRCEAVMEKLHKRGFSFFDGEVIVLAFATAAEAVMGRLWLSEFESFADSDLSDHEFSLTDHPELADAIAEMRDSLDLELGTFSVILVDVSVNDHAEVEEIIEASA